MVREGAGGPLSLGEALEAARTPSGRYGKAAVERLVLRFLRTAPVYRSAFRDVRLWRDSPYGDDTKPPISMVAEGHDGSTTAILCHYGSLGHAKAAGFLEAAGSRGFGAMVVHVDGEMSGRARRDLEGAATPVLSRGRLDGFGADWGFAAPPRAPVLNKRQTEAVDAVSRGLAHADRGVLVMPPGTGKALVALQVAERMAGPDRTVLVVSPSLARMVRAMREWAGAAAVPLNVLAAYSAEHAGRGESAADLDVPAAAGPGDLAARFGRRPAGAMTVVFSTYGSAAGIVAGACGEFDLAICQDAHAAAGTGPPPGISAAKRLYTTATPQMPDPRRAGRNIRLMDAETYGEELHRLELGGAVGDGMASDFAIKVVLVSERASRGIYRRSAGSVPAAERAAVAAAWRAVLNPGGGLPPLRAIAGTVRSGGRARQWADWFARLAKHAAGPSPVRAEARPAAASPPADAGWLDGLGTRPGSCRALFAPGPPGGPVAAVLFADAPPAGEAERCVGSVVRRRPGAGSGRGYLLVPIALGGAAAGEPPDAALGAAWTVLAAACAHDMDLRRELAALDLEEAPDPHPAGDGSLTIPVGRRIEVDMVAAPGELDGKGGARLARRMRTAFVERAGGAGHYGAYAERLAAAACDLERRVADMVAASPLLVEKIGPLAESLGMLMGGSATPESAARILAQHMAFGGLLDMFHGGEFSRLNPVARAIREVVSEMGLDGNVWPHHPEHAGMPAELRHIDTGERRRNFMLMLYEAYVRLRDPGGRTKRSDLPAEAADFMVRSVQHVLRDEFGAGLDDRSVRLLDPFSGAGAFVTRLLEATSPDSMHGKYGGEIYASDCSLAAYYTTTACAEFTHQVLSGARRYVPFTGASYTDTFGPGGGTGGPLLGDAAERAARHYADSVRVIVGDPPRSPGPGPDARHPGLEARIRETYGRAARAAGHSASTMNVKSPYLKAQRWATDRLRGSGVVGFVVPAEYITKDSKAGLRACLREEFTDVWCLDLRGGPSSRDDPLRDMMVLISVRNPRKAGHSVHYARISRRYSGRDKLDQIKKAGSIEGIGGWRVVPAGPRHRWVRPRDA